MHKFNVLTTFEVYSKLLEAQEMVRGVCGLIPDFPRIAARCSVSNSSLVLEFLDRLLSSITPHIQEGMQTLFTTCIHNFPFARVFELEPPIKVIPQIPFEMFFVSPYNVCEDKHITPANTFRSPKGWIHLSLQTHKKYGQKHRKWYVASHINIDYGSFFFSPIQQYASPEPKSLLIWNIHKTSL